MFGTMVVVNKRKESIIEMLKERFQEEQCEGYWRFTIREALMKEEDAAELKVLKDYTLVRGELYRRMPGGILTYGSYGKVNLYCRLQRAGFYWPSMGKDADQVQTQCGTCQLAADKAESYAVFASEDWRSPFTQYLTESILPQKHSKRFKLKRRVWGTPREEKVVQMPATNGLLLAHHYRV